MGDHVCYVLWYDICVCDDACESRILRGFNRHSLHYKLIQLLEADPIIRSRSNH